MNRSIRLIIAVSSLVVVSSGLVDRRAEAIEMSDFEVAFGLKGLSHLTKNGVLLYDSWQVLPVPVVKYHPWNLELIGSQLFFKTPLLDSLILKTVLNLNSIPEPLYRTGGADTQNPPLAKSRELEVLLSNHEPWFNVLLFTASIQQDLQAHFGRFYQVQLAAQLFETKSQNGAIQLLATVNFGQGDQRFNSGFYQTNRHPSYRKYGLQVTAAPLVDRIYPILTLYNEELDQALGPALRPSTSLVVELILAKKLYP